MDNLVRRVTSLEDERQVQEVRIAVLESELERLGEKVCRCGERSPVSLGLGTREEPFTLEYADEPEDSDQDSYRSVPVAPVEEEEEEVPMVEAGPSTQLVGVLVWCCV
jgi:hypothetical protein